MKYDIITLGSATVDMFAKISSKFKDAKPGDKVLIDYLNFEIGGGGINSAIAFSRMGLKTAFLGKVGLDHNAINIIRKLKEENIDFLNLNPSKDPTSFSFILNSKKEKDRIIYTYKGASDNLSLKDIDWNSIKSTRWIYMATLLEESFKTLEKIAFFAKKNNIRIMFNPSSYLAKLGTKNLKKILYATTILVLNKKEAKLMLGTKSDNINNIIKGLLRSGPNMTVVTQGNKGAYFSDGSIIAFSKPYDVKVISTAGAGDAFASGFLSGIIKKDYAHALELGMANSASVIQYYGAKNKLLSYSEAKNYITKNKLKISIKPL